MHATVPEQLTAVGGTAASPLPASPPTAGSDEPASEPVLAGASVEPSDGPGPPPASLVAASDMPDAAPPPSAASLPASPRELVVSASDSLGPASRDTAPPSPDASPASNEAPPPSVDPTPESSAEPPALLASLALKPAPYSIRKQPESRTDAASAENPDLHPR